MPVSHKPSTQPRQSTACAEAAGAEDNNPAEVTMDTQPENTATGATAACGNWLASIAKGGSHHS